MGSLCNVRRASLTSDKWNNQPIGAEGTYPNSATDKYEFTLDGIGDHDSIIKPLNKYIAKTTTWISPSTTYLAIPIQNSVTESAIKGTILLA